MIKRAIMAALLAGALLLAGCAYEQAGSLAAVPGDGAGANFRFLISDEKNDIDDFKNLYVTIDKIGVQSGNESGEWLEFAPLVAKIDLKPLDGLNAQQIWSGNLTPGTYSKVFVYVGEVEGILADNTSTAVKLPSGKLQISKPFTVGDNNTASFVFDITVKKAGNSGKYILQPQIAESGADQEFNEVNAPNQNQPQGKPEKEKNQERNREQNQSDNRTGNKPDK